MPRIIRDTRAGENSELWTVFRELAKHVPLTAQEGSALAEQAMKIVTYGQVARPNGKTPDHPRAAFTKDWIHKTGSYGRLLEALKRPLANWRLTISLALSPAR